MTSLPRSIHPSLACLRISAAVVLSLLLAVPVLAQSSFVNTLMPLPSKVEARPGALHIDSGFTYTLQGDRGQRVSDAAARFIGHLEMRTGVSLASAAAPEGKSAVFTINVATKSLQAVPQPNEDESYTLDVDEHAVTLNAKTDLGALHGMETLLQLVQPSGSAYVLPAIHIEDAPRFPWRGLMIDSGRHFLPMPVVLRTLDGMAAVKLNVLHWHLTEDQGFRIESKVYPKLSSLGSNGEFYTQDQVREVIAYASARGIRVVPEFDMPGHTQSWMVGYPELGSAPGPFAISKAFGVMDAAMDPTRESTFEFLNAFLGEMAQLFPDPYLHIGGDESNGKEWRANPKIAAFMQAHGMKTTEELQSYFSTRVQKILAAHHKQMVGWDEILSPTLPQDAVIQNWHGIQFLIDAAKQGHRVFLSQPYYIDHNFAAGTMFLADPIPANSGLTPEQAKLILGGEACMWAEHVDSDTIDSRIWPRTAAIAERLWSPASDRDVDDMYRRLAVESLRLDGAGLTHISGPARMLRNLAGTTETQPLDVFAGTLQPVNFPVRSREQRATTDTVFDRLVDSVSADPPLQHEMPALVQAALNGDAASLDRLNNIFNSWVAAAPGLDRLQAGSPLLQEASVHIAAFPKLGSMGVEAVGYLRSGKTASAEWKNAQEAILKNAVKPSELVEFVVLKPLQALVDAVSTARPQ